ncbi:MAG: PQQ-binding-like beta-propeller repeat protein [Akkermansiaceae bacterium]|nr:PQQ-binding-like beta-propeller repeat protein [Akkermansiaceae bacterium]
MTQTTAGDAFSAACTAGGADPIAIEDCGPDLDFGSAPILRTLPNEKQLLFAGQKSGVMHALDPDKEGAIVWQKKLSPGGVLGGIEWGFAADEKRLYVPISDIWETGSTPGAAGGLFALAVEDGEIIWHTKAASPDSCLDRAGCNAGQPAAATLIPGVVFSASMDGHVRAYSPETGEVLWDYDTNRPFDTVNGVEARGGSVNGPGVTVVDGWLYVGTGYGLFGMPGNALLAFGPPSS